MLGTFEALFKKSSDAPFLTKLQSLTSVFLKESFIPTEGHVANPKVQILVIPNMHAPGRVVFFFFFSYFFFRPHLPGRFRPTKMAKKFPDGPETGKNTPNGQKSPLSTPSNFLVQGLKTCAPSG